jgi:pullulanase/glycogen debranching enzyme
MLSSRAFSRAAGFDGKLTAPEAGKEFLLSALVVQQNTDVPGRDEFLNTQSGNNNPYNQDSEIGWFDPRPH